MKIPEMMDITAPESVEIKISDDHKTLWVNVDGVCRLRCCRIGEVVLDIKLLDDLVLLVQKLRIGGIHGN